MSVLKKLITTTYEMMFVYGQLTESNIRSYNKIQLDLYIFERKIDRNGSTYSPKLTEKKQSNAFNEAIEGVVDYVNESSLIMNTKHNRNRHNIKRRIILASTCL